MEINITKLKNAIEGGIAPVYGSIAQYGPNAAEYTWNNALEAAVEHELFPTESDDYAREFFQDFGAWSRDELGKMSHFELVALTIQHVAGELSDGDASGSIFQDGDDWYCYIVR